MAETRGGRASIRFPSCGESRGFDIFKGLRSREVIPYTCRCDCGMASAISEPFRADTSSEPRCTTPGAGPGCAWCTTRSSRTTCTCHLHLIVECDHRQGLARGMQAFASTLARALNALARRHGPVFVDRYFAHILKTPREVAYAVRYVLGNLLHHFGRPDDDSFYDPYSSRSFHPGPPQEAPVLAPRTWLLRTASG